MRDASAAEKHRATLEDEETVGRLLTHMKASALPVLLPQEGRYYFCAAGSA